MKQPEQCAVKNPLGMLYICLLAAGTPVQITAPYQKLEAGHSTCKRSCHGLHCKQARSLGRPARSTRYLCVPQTSAHTAAAL